MKTQGAYAGLRVLDLGQGVAAPYCAMLLAMLADDPRFADFAARAAHSSVLAEIGIDPVAIARLCAESILPIPKASSPRASRPGRQ
jgi:hypothetical protein